jgi:hypothetical protein
MDREQVEAYLEGDQDEISVDSGVEEVKEESIPEVQRELSDTLKELPNHAGDSLAKALEQDHPEIYRSLENETRDVSDWFAEGIRMADTFYELQQMIE